jgi:hypothetical protein
LSAIPASGQVLIYKMEFKQVDTLNLEYFTEGYFVTEALGGSASFVLGGRENGRKVLTEGSGQFAVGEDNHGKRHALLSAGGGSSDEASSSFVAFGPVNTYLHMETPIASIRVSVASKLSGASVASGTQAATSTAKPPEVFANICQIKAELDERQTRLSNRRGQDVAAAAAAVKILMQNKGYNAASTTDGGTTGTTVTTTSAP